MKLAKKGCRSCRTSIVTQPAVSVERCVMVFRTPTIGSSATIPEPVKRLGEYQACMVWEYQACMVHPSQQLRYAALSSTRYPLLSIAHSTKAHLIKQIKPIEQPSRSPRPTAEPVSIRCAATKSRLPPPPPPPDMSQRQCRPFCRFMGASVPAVHGPAPRCLSTNGVEPTSQSVARWQL